MFSGRRIGRSRDQLSRTLRVAAPMVFVRCFIAPLLVRFIEELPSLDMDLLLQDLGELDRHACISCSVMQLNGP